MICTGHVRLVWPKLLLLLGCRPLFLDYLHATLHMFGGQNSVRSWVVFQSMLGAYVLAIEVTSLGSALVQHENNCLAHYHAIFAGEYRN